MRQLGSPTWFCSFSAAETKWIPLLKTLGKLIDNVTYTEDDINSLSWDEKVRPSNLFKVLWLQVPEIS